MEPQNIFLISKRYRVIAVALAVIIDVVAAAAADGVVAFAGKEECVLCLPREAVAAIGAPQPLFYH